VDKAEEAASNLYQSGITTSTLVWECICVSPACDMVVWPLNVLSACIQANINNKQ